jgi:16S rRNA (guanine527-N7)-methyltransferase
MSDILKTYNVSRETIEKLKTYEKLVLEWNNKFNLVSKSSVPYIWERHIEDSLQLCGFITKSDKIMFDFGSGAGFPGVVIAIIAQELYPDLKVSLIESIGKKANFLKVVNDELLLNMDIYNDRIEKLNLTKADVITSRAMASLEKLLEYSKPFCSNKTRLLFLKGERWQEEVREAEKKWRFDFTTKQSQTSDRGCVLQIENIRRK